MKKLKFNLLTGLLLLISVSVFAAGFPPPDKVQEIFQNQGGRTGIKRLV